MSLERYLSCKGSHTGNSWVLQDFLLPPYPELLDMGNHLAMLLLIAQHNVALPSHNALQDVALSQPQLPTVTVYHI
jgi:hypothetical protein